MCIYKYIHIYIYICIKYKKPASLKMPMYNEPKQHGVDLHLDGFGMFQGWVEVTTASRSFQFSKSGRPEFECLSCKVIEPGRCSIP